jgi:predicted dehydrogenase
MTDPHRPLRLVQIGLGGWGRSWKTVVDDQPGVQPVAYVDASEDALAATRALGVPAGLCFTTLSDALHTRPDVALVTTSAAGHAPVAQAALEAGLHVLVEKPFAPTLAEAARVTRLAEERGLTLMVAQNYRHHPAPRLAARLVEGGRLGDVTLAEIDFRRGATRTAPPASPHHTIDHPLLLDMAVPPFRPRADGPRARGARRDGPRGPARLEPLPRPARRVRHPRTERRRTRELPRKLDQRGTRHAVGGEWRVEGERGELAWTSRGDPGVPDRVRLRPPGGRARAVTLPSVASLDRAGVLAAFSEAVRAGTEPESSGRDNLGTLAVTLAAIRSAERGRRVALTELHDEQNEAQQNEQEASP